MKNGLFLGMFVLALCLVCADSIYAQSSPIYPDRMENDYAEVMARAERMSKENKWSTAVVQYQTVLEKNIGKVWYDEKRSGGSYFYYYGVSEFVGDKLRQMPPEGKQAYHTLYDFQAQAIFNKAAQERSEYKLLEIAMRYPIASVAPDCLQLLGDIRFEKGEISQATDFWNKALKVCPPEDLKSQGLNFRLSCAYAYLGNSEESAKYLKAVTVPPALPIDGGQKPQEILKKMAAESSWAQTVLQTGDWTNLLKNPQADMLNQCQVTFPTRSFLFTFLPVDGGWPPPRQYYNQYGRQPSDPYSEDLNWDRAHLLRLGERLIGRTNSTIFAFDLQTNSIVWQQHFRNKINPRRSYIQCNGQPEMTISGGNIYVCFDRQLICLSASAGDILWERELPTGEGQNPSRSMEYFTGPIFVGDKIFIGLNRVSQETAEACSYLFCFNSENGKVVREQMLGSRSTMENIEGRGRFRGSPINFHSAPLPLVARDGDIFFGNNFSMMARVSAESGEIRWLVGYQNSSIKVWRGRSPLFDGDRLYVASEDGRVIHVLNWENGSIDSTYDVIPTTLYKNNQLIGVRDGLMILGGRNITGLKLDNEKRQWVEVWKLPLGDDLQWGQAVWSEKYLYVPTQHHLLVMEILEKEARILNKCPIERVANYPGNLIADRDHVYSLSDLCFQVFEDTAPLLASVEAKLTKNPGDHMLLYNKGQCLTAANKIPEAIDIFQKAYASVPQPDAQSTVKQVYLNGTFENSRWMIARRIYELCYQCSYREEKSPDAVEHALKYFELARKFASNDTEKADVYHELAKNFAKAGKHTQAAEMLKEMILLPPGTSVRAGAVELSSFVMGRAQLAALAKKAGKTSAELLENSDVPPSPEQINAMKFEDLWKIYILNPDSKRCQAIIPALAAKFTEKADHAAAYSLLRSLWDAAPSPSSCQVLLNALEQQGEWGVAKQLLFEAREKIGGQPAPKGGVWKKFADDKLATEPYLSTSILAPEFKISAHEKYIYKFPQEISLGSENLDLSQTPNNLMIVGTSPDRQTQILAVDVVAGKMLWQKAAYAFTKSILFDQYLVMLGSGTFIYNRNTGAELKSLPLHLPNVTMAHGQLILTGLNATDIYVYNAADLKEIGKYNTQKIFGVQRNVYYGKFNFQPMENNWLLLWSDSGFVTGINTKDNKQMAMTQLGGPPPGQVIWSGKNFGRTVLFWRTVGYTRSLISVNIETGKQTVLGNITASTMLPREIVPLTENTQLHISPSGLDKVVLEGENNALKPKKIWSTPPNETYLCNRSLVSGTTAYALSTQQKQLVEISLKDGAKRFQTKLFAEQNVTFDNANFRGNPISFTLLTNTGRYLVYKLSLMPLERYFGTEPAFCRVVIYDKMLHQNVWQRDFMGLTVCGAKSWNGILYLLTNDGNLYRYGD